MTRQDVAKIPRRHTEINGVSVAQPKGINGLEIAREVVDHLGCNTRPVNGVNRANAHT